MLDRLRKWAWAIKRDVRALTVASRDARTPWFAKLMALLVAGYALSPIDLIPDFIPVLGYLDEVLLLPLGIALVVRMIPTELMAEYRLTAERLETERASRTAAVVIAVIWAALFIGATWLTWKWLAAEPSSI